MSGLRILVVDGHADSARALGRLLRHHGHTVVTAHTCAGAMALAVGQQPFQALVCDVDLSDGDGCELLRRLGAYARRPLPAVAMTAYGGAEKLEQCRAAGYTRLLLKPVLFDEVLAALATLPNLPTMRAPAARAGGALRASASVSGESTK